MFAINTSLKKTVLVLDNFYENPMEVRKFALDQTFSEDISWYKGLRTKEQFLFSGLKETFETRIGHNISLWEDHQYNGCFQITTSEDRQVYHCDENSWAGVLYLTPDAPVDAGTVIFDDNENLVTMIGNVYNRLVIYRGDLYHRSLEPGFGDCLENGRLTQVFFFDEATYDR